MAKKKGLPASPFVPAEEQPYSIPENWCWIRFSNIMELISGRDAALTDCNSEGIGIPYILGASNIENNTFTIERWIKKPQVVSTKGDILLSVKGTIGKLYIQKEEKVNISRQIMAIRPLEILNRELTYLFLQLVCDELREAGNGLIPGISRTDILDKAFPFMPLSEQHRIVDRIESLFAKLDEAKEKAQAVLDGFELRKSAILHKAFTGELTERWRKEHSVSIESWSIKQLGEVTEIKSSKRIYKEEYVESGIPFFRSSEVVELNDFGFTEPQFFISPERYEEIKSQYGVPKQGDLLVTSVGTIGKTWIVDSRPFYYKDGNLTQVKQCFALDMKYLQLYIQSEEFKEQIRSSVAGSAYNALTIVKFKKIKVPIPSQKEQSAIVCVLDSIFAQEQQAKETAETVLDQIDTMKKAILARAFRGELGTNDPAEEWAGEMVKICI